MICLRKQLALLKWEDFISLMICYLNPIGPEGHADKVERFIVELENRNDIILTKLNWSTGIIVVTKIK